MSKTLLKQPAESRIYTMDFSANLGSGESVSTIDSVAASPSGLTIEDQAVTADGKKIQFRISGGADGTSYKITATVNTSSENILEGDGILNVKQI